MTAPGDPPPPAPRDPLRWCFESRETGRITIAQWPNLPLWIFIVAFAAQVILKPTGTLGTALAVIGALGLVWWALDEMIRGCNPWRRVLGAAVLLLLAYRSLPLLVH